MTLDIIVPHYKEPWEVCKYLFDSIAMQRGISFNNIRVIVVNDGDYVVFDPEQIPEYPYKIICHVKPHEGVSAARNYGLDNSTADYVMFCDSDDGFLNNYGLHLAFSAMQEGYDYIYSNFIEETYTADNTMTIIRHDNDFTFMHGKLYKREFLVKHNIRFDPAMTIHEDGYFNSVALCVAQKEGTLKRIDTPFYLWRWNDNSTVRKDRTDFVLKTYDKLMQTRIGTCTQLRDRGYADDFKTAVCMTVMNSYYDFQKPSYHYPRNAKHLQKAESAFRGFWRLFKDTFRQCNNQEISTVSQAARNTAAQNGMFIEREALGTFLKRIEK